MWSRGLTLMNAVGGETRGLWLGDDDEDELDSVRCGRHCVRVCVRVHPLSAGTKALAEGYSEKRTSPDTFRVKFVANACTSGYVLRGYLRRRAVELTLQYGFRYFTILGDAIRPTELEAREVPAQDAPRKWETVVFESPSKGTMTMPIQCFKDANKPETRLIDAKEYLKGIDN